MCFLGLIRMQPIERLLFFNNTKTMTEHLVLINNFCSLPRPCPYNIDFHKRQPVSIDNSTTAFWSEKH